MPALPPQQSPEQPSATPQQRLRELQAAVSSLQAAALDSQQQVAAAQAATADLGAQAVLVDAYCRRVQRLATLLQHYDAHLQAALAALGLAAPKQQQEVESGSPALAAADAAAALANGLRQVEEQLTVATLGATATPNPEALLQLGACAKSAAARAAAAGPAAILAQLQASVQADCESVNQWPALAPPAPAVGDAAAAASLLGPAFARLHTDQTERWEAAAAQRQQLEELRAEVAAARAVLNTDANSNSPSAAAEAAVRIQLVAQQAGLRAELDCLDRMQQAAEAAAAAAARRAAAVQAARDGVAALEAQEEALDGAVCALCCADSLVMRQWRQGTWQAQEVVEAGVLAQRQPLASLGRRLAEVQRQEMAAFRRQADNANATRPVAATEQPAASAGSGGASSRGQTLAAAQLLDPLAGLKTEAAAAAVVAAASTELQELQPVTQQWSELAAASGDRLAALRATAAELEGAMGALRAEGGAAPLAQLREAAAAAEEGSAAVVCARQALSEWWTTPAVTATPWVKREGRSAEEWLRLLGDQQRAQRQREQVLTDSNRRRAVVS